MRIFMLYHVGITAISDVITTRFLQHDFVISAVYIFSAISKECVSSLEDCISTV